MGDIHNSIYGVITLECNHQLHYHCYKGLLEKNILKCPICKKFLPIDSDRESIVKYQIQAYKRVIIPKKYTGMIVTVQCNDCLRKFPSQWHFIYYCPWCKLFNCEIVNTDVKLYEAV